MELDEARLNEVQERIDLLEKLKRKYGGTLESVLETFDKLSQELNAIEFSTQNIEESAEAYKEEIKKNI